MASAKQKARGLLDPVRRSDQLPPTDIPDPSRYLPTNTNVGSGYNTLAQVLAQGQSPGNPGTQPYYSQASFRSPTGQTSGMARYAPREALGDGARGNWDQRFWRDWLKRQGVGPEGNRQRLGMGQPQGQPGGQPGGQFGGQGPNMLPNNFLQWLQSTYPGINFGAIMNGGMGQQNATPAPTPSPGPMQRSMQAYQQAMGPSQPGQAITGSQQYEALLKMLQ